MASQLPPGYIPYQSSADKVGVSGTAGELSNVHPEYACRQADWQQMRDTWSGQRAVKSRGQCYLPATSGMLEDGMGCNGKGALAYNAYLTRALFHSFISDAVDTMLGMLWNKPPIYELPTEMEYLLQKCTTGGEGLKQFHRGINRQQLIPGRVGALVDLPSTAGTGQPQPYIAMYFAEKIINWDAGFRGETAVETTNLVVLDECGPVRVNTFGWDTKQQFRVLMLGTPDGNEPNGIYRYGVFSGDSSEAVEFDFSKMIEATSRGTPFNHIPFTFINANSTLSTPCDPPLLGLSDLSLAIYRLEADYRQALFMQTQDTLFTKGFSDSEQKPLRTGAGARIHSNVKDADAKFIGVASQGLPELRTARENDLKMAASKAGELMDASSRARESGTALEMRIGSKTATMEEIAISAAEGLERVLRDVGMWIGVKDLKSIVVKPNKEFASREFAALDFKNLVEAKVLGAPFSWEALHKWSVERGGPGKDLDFKDMMAQIEGETEHEATLAPKITPEKQAELDIAQQQADDAAEAAERADETAKIAAKNKPKPAGPPR